MQIENKIDVIIAQYSNNQANKTQEQFLFDQQKEYIERHHDQINKKS